MQERLIVTPYIYRKQIDGKEYLGNHLSCGHYIESTMDVNGILGYFQELKYVPVMYSTRIGLIKELIRLRFLVEESKLYLPCPNVELEITNRCNAACVICPRDKITRNRGDMEGEVFRCILAELRKVKVNQVEICGVGEPLLHKDVVEYVKLLKESGVNHVKLITNASLLDDKMAGGLVEAGLDTIMISFHSIYTDKYMDIMKGLQYDLVLSNVKNFISKYSKRVHISITCVLTKGNIEEKEEFIDFWHSMGVEDIFFQKIQSRAGLLYDIDETNSQYRCPVREQGIFISKEGEYLSCSNDFSGITSMGTVTSLSLKKYLLEKQKYIRSKKDWKICRNCDYDFIKYKYLPTLFYSYVSYKGVQDEEDLFI